MDVLQFIEGFSILAPTAGAGLPIADRKCCEGISDLPRKRTDQGVIERAWEILARSEAS